VGLGIALSGTLAWLGGRQPASWLWLELGILALLGTAFVGMVLREGGAAPEHRTDSFVPTTAPSDGPRGHWALVLCYGAFGFGYIIPATFLPAMAQQLVADPLVFGLTWPLFGLAAVISVAVAARWLAHWPRRRVWAFAQAAMALGTALPLVGQSLWTLSASAVLVGGTVVVTTMAGLQFAREQVPANPTALQGRMTAAFAAGQIAGPLLVRVLGPDLVGAWSAFDWANATATLVLALTALWLWLGREPSPAQRGGTAG
jgi:MFS family permease